MDDRTVGILGGGQLGRMLTEAAHRMNIKVAVLDSENSPAKQINSSDSHVNGSFADPNAIRELAKQCDILTIEIEHVNTEVLKEIEEEGVEIVQGGKAARKKVKTEPSWRTIRVIQDKYLQKDHLHNLKVPTAHSIALPSNSAEALAEAGKELGYPFVLKSRTQAYDGRGNFPVQDATYIPAALGALGKRPLYAEKWVKFKGEVAVMVVKIYDRPLPCNNENVWKSDTLAYPVVETVHENSICKTVFASPTPTSLISEDLANKAEVMARKAVAGFWGTGIFGVEMFVTDEDDILINEIAPRPHNSGHYTIEGCYISQYDAHIRAILRLPFPISENQGSLWSPSTNLKPKTAAIMYNILGGPRPDSHIELCKLALVTPGASLHLYGKGDARPGRKMGHITVISETIAQAREVIEPLRLCDIRSTNAVASIPNLAVSIPAPPASQAQALVAVTMGSDSDLPVLKPGIALLRDLNIPCCVTITSAHRTPGRMIAFAKEAASRGIKVIIAAAGGAAHLPGMVAANTPLPVIGVPVKGSTLDGMDSLLSIVQMPRGVPVATVAINNSLNAALLAARILGTYDEGIRLRVEKYAGDMEAVVNEKIDRLDADGWENYVVLR